MPKEPLLDTKSARPLALYFAIAVALILAFMPLDASAATAPANGAEALRMAADGIQSKLDQLVANKQLQQIGITLFGFFVLANAMWLLIKGYASGAGLNGVMADAINLALMAGIVHIFLQRDVGVAIVQSVNQIAALLMGGTAPTTANLMNEAAVTAFQTLANMFKLNLPELTLGNLLNFNVVYAAFLLKMVAVAVSAFLIILALCMYFAVLVTSQVSVVIALIMAPVFVPFLLFQPASFMFDGWLRFTIGAALMKVIGLIMLVVTREILAQLTELSTLSASSGNSPIQTVGVDIVLYSAMILLAGLSAYLMMQVPGISTGLISGSGGAAGFSGWANIASKSAATRGVMGGMNAGQANTRAASAMGGGGGGAGGKPQMEHSLSRVQAALPNALKPVASGVGRLASWGAATQKAKAHHRAGAADQSRTYEFDRGKMSATARRAYDKAFEAANQRMSKEGRGHVTLQTPKRSMDMPQPAPPAPPPSKP